MALSRTGAGKVQDWPRDLGGAKSKKVTVMGYNPLNKIRKP